MPWLPSRLHRDALPVSLLWRAPSPTTNGAQTGAAIRGEATYTRSSKPSPSLMENALNADGSLTASPLGAPAIGGSWPHP